MFSVRGVVGILAAWRECWEAGDGTLQGELLDEGEVAMFRKPRIREVSAVVRDAQYVYTATGWEPVSWWRRLLHTVSGCPHTLR